MAIKRKWHNLETEEVLSIVQGSVHGLSDKEAGIRLNKFGPNELPQQKPYSTLRLFFNQFNNPLMFILFGTIAVSLTLKHYTDTAFIVLVLLANTLVGFYQENKANNSINQLKKLVRIQARIIRNGKEKEIDSRELVSGDIIILHSGDKIPADARILESRSFKTNEASLTGESMPVAKQIKKKVAETELADQNNMVFMGTIAEEGWAKAVVVSIGLSTQIGQIVSMLSETQEPKTPLQVQIARLAKLATGFVITVICIIIIIGYFRFESPSEILLASLSLAVSAIPSGLLPAITVILVLGMRRILKQNGLVRKLVANETLGSVTVICTDKTGTLTEGKMEATYLITATKELTGKKLANFNLSNSDLQSESLKQLAKIASLDNDAYIENPQASADEWLIRGKTTEQALLRLSALIGFDKQVLEQEYLLLDKVYFSSELKYSASLRAIDSDGSSLFVIGAPEVVLEKVVNLENSAGPKFQKQSPEFQKLEKRIEELTGHGLRIVACAYRQFADRPKYKKPNDLVKDLTLVGLIALEDPIRNEVVEAIATATRAGIKTLIVTGDHKLTALAVAKKIGLKINAQHMVEGRDIDNFSDEQLRQKVSKLLIYARISPKHKLRIVNALRARGEIVAMVGDGVNDAPALKAADIGVAVNSGTDMAKEVADLILLDNGFHSIVRAIEQGRIIFANIRKVFVYLVADDFSELFIFLASLSFGLPLPLLPAQILWINLVEDGLPDLALTTEQESTYVMDRPPHKYGEPILTPPLKKWLACLFAISGLAAFALFFFGLKFIGNLHLVRTMVFALMGLDSLVFAFSVRSFHRTIFRRDILKNRLLVAATLISFIFLITAIYTPFMQKLLATQSLQFSEWIIILTTSALEIILIEATKKIFMAGKI